MSPVIPHRPLIFEIWEDEVVDFTSCRSGCQIARRTVAIPNPLCTFPFRIRQARCKITLYRACPVVRCSLGEPAPAAQWVSQSFTDPSIACALLNCRLCSWAFERSLCRAIFIPLLRPRVLRGPEGLEVGLSTDNVKGPFFFACNGRPSFTHFLSALHHLPKVSQLCIQFLRAFSSTTQHI